jgi:hypothetical protein
MQEGQQNSELERDQTLFVLQAFSSSTTFLVDKFWCKIMHKSLELTLKLCNKLSSPIIEQIGNIYFN